MSLLEAHELCKYFDLSGGLLGRVFNGKSILKAVDHVSFSVPEGKTLGLVGESGCGKSTTARLVGAFDTANLGADFHGGPRHSTPREKRDSRITQGRSNGFSRSLRFPEPANENPGYRRVRVDDL